MFDILEILPRPYPEIHVLDIGAMSFGLHTEPYSALQKAGICRVTGFEPVVSECEKLKSIYPEGTFLPYCAGDGDAKPFYVTNHSMTSSLYEPDEKLLTQFENLSELVQVASVHQMKTHKLSDISDLTHPVDYIKNDTQGAEVEIFSNAGRVLDDAVVVHAEVEFVALYKNQPLFADVDRTLRARGFEFHKLLNISGRRFKTFANESPEMVPESQMLWADAIYLKDWMMLDLLTNDQLVKMAIILHFVYGSSDLAHRALAAFDARNGTTVAGAYKLRMCSPAVKVRA